MEDTNFVKTTESIQPEDAPSKIIFNITENGEVTALIEISNEGFFYKGERVDDAQNVYNRFNEWLTIAQKYKS